MEGYAAKHDQRSGAPGAADCSDLSRESTEATMSRGDGLSMSATPTAATPTAATPTAAPVAEPAATETTSPPPVAPSAPPGSLDQSRTQQLHQAAELAHAAGGTSVPDLEEFLTRYYQHVATEDLLAREPADLLGAALDHRDLAQRRPVGTSNLSVSNPSVESQGWASGHTIVQIVTDDMPFLVDSVTQALSLQGRGVYLVVHPILTVRRDALGDLQEVQLRDPDAAAGDSTSQFGVVAESWMHLEIDRVGPERDRELIVDALRQVLGNVRDAVEDWPKMREHCKAIAAQLHDDPPVGIPEHEASTAVRFLRWLSANHFTFLGYREYVLEHQAGDDYLNAVPGTGLGILRYDRPEARGNSEAFARLSALTQAKARERELLIITKANSRATVHRAVYLDYIGLKTFDDKGNVVGERRFLGLFASSAYTESILNIPILRERARQVLETTGFTLDSHSGKDLLEVMESYPRDELFQIDPDELLRDRDRGAARPGAPQDQGCSYAATSTAGSSRAWSTCRGTATTPRSA